MPGWPVTHQVRETSRKPDEMYSLLERLSPGTRKLEIFARQHNCQPGWVSLGNQVPLTSPAQERVLGVHGCPVIALPAVIALQLLHVLLLGRSCATRA